MTQAIITMIPEAWQNDANMSASKKAYYRWNAYSMEPWDGPGLSACLSVCVYQCHSASLAMYGVEQNKTRWLCFVEHSIRLDALGYLFDCL